MSLKVHMIHLKGSYVFLPRDTARQRTRLCVCVVVVVGGGGGAGSIAMHAKSDGKIYRRHHKLPVFN